MFIFVIPPPLLHLSVGNKKRIYIKIILEHDKYLLMSESDKGNIKCSLAHPSLTRYYEEYFRQEERNDDFISVRNFFHIILNIIKLKCRLFLTPKAQLYIFELSQNWVIISFYNVK